MAEATHILLIDDSTPDSDYIAAFTARARDFGIKIKHFERGKSGLDELTANPYKYKALILDAKCIWDETGAFPSDKFLSRMVLELERLEGEMNAYFPAVVNTAYIEEFQEERQMMLRRGGDIFHKSSNSEEDEAKIFRFLQDRVNNSDEWKYRGVLSIFAKGHLSEKMRNDLLNIIRKLNDTTNTKRNFAELRKFVEAIYEAINRKDPSLIPPPVFSGRGGVGVNLEWTWRYLSGFPVEIVRGRGPTFQAAAVFPPHVSKCIKACEEMSSTITHLYGDSVSIYGYQAATFGLLEALVWFDGYMDK